MSIEKIKNIQRKLGDLKMKDFRNREKSEKSFDDLFNEKSEIIATRLREARKRRGSTQEYVSSLLNLGKNTYGTYEKKKGLPDAVRIALLAKHYKVSSDYLLGIIDTYSHVDKTLKDLRLSDDAQDDLKKITYNKRTKNVFEMMIHSKAFLDLLHYIDTYLQYSVKMDDAVIENLKNKDLYDEVYKLDVSKKKTIDIEALPLKGIDVSDIYSKLIEDKLMGIIKEIGKENKTQFQDKMIENIREIIYQHDNKTEDDK